MATQVTLKLAPSQFDELRDALKRDNERQLELANNQHVEPAKRNKARSNAVVTSTLIEFINRS